MRSARFLCSVGLIWLGLSPAVDAWTHKDWSIHALLSAASLVVVATPISENVISARAPLQNATSGLAADPNVYVDDVETTFNVMTHIKGRDDVLTVVLHHSRYTDNRGPMMAGPQPVELSAGSGKRYLMFLERDSDNRWKAVSGLLDSSEAIFAID
jgi:hypothetical protein